MSRANIENKILHGTTTVGIRASDGVVLCADMRASAGYFIANNNTMKIQKIDDHAGLTLAGGVADAQNIVDILRYHAGLHRVERDGAPIGINSLARLCSLIFHQNRGYPFIADILVGGYDDSEGPALFNIDMFGSVEPKPYVTTGSGSPVAYGAAGGRVFAGHYGIGSQDDRPQGGQGRDSEKHRDGRRNQLGRDGQRRVPAPDRRAEKGSNQTLVI